MVADIESCVYPFHVTLELLDIFDSLVDALAHRKGYFCFQGHFIEGVGRQLRAAWHALKSKQGGACRLIHTELYLCGFTGICDFVTGHTAQLLAESFCQSGLNPVGLLDGK